MCGITLSIHPVSLDGAAHHTLLESLIFANGARGPDTQSTYTKRFEVDGGEVEIVLSSSVLGLRGGVVAQPLVGKRGVLAWNGQVFDGLQVDTGDNDTERIFQALEAGTDPLELLGSIEGPYAFVYLDLEASKLYFQLDPLSRRSLLMTTEGGSVLLSSSRSAEVRKQGMEMRALLGGEGGTVDLTKLVINERLDVSKALVMRSAPHVDGRFTRLRGIDMQLPAEEPHPSKQHVGEFIKQLTRSIRYRVENIPPRECRVAVLFSGGVDCTLVAALLHRCLPLDEPVELINVAFAPPKGESWATPDRISGLEAWKELGIASPREWRFVEVNVSYEECQIHRQSVVDLMYPSETEMDLSLAYPLYFASRGQGRLHDSSEAYHVGAKVYLSGLGADEQLGGYSRHRRAFRQGWQGLADEIQMDIDRLPTRNLSRDDRIISSHARDARYPYLDLSFVSFLSDLPIWVKCNPAHPEGYGDKILLRQAAVEVGLPVTGHRVKRAMQFGTRSSKMSGGNNRPRAGQKSIT